MSLILLKIFVFTRLSNFFYIYSFVYLNIHINFYIFALLFTRIFMFIHIHSYSYPSISIHTHIRIHNQFHSYSYTIIFLLILTCSSIYPFVRSTISIWWHSMQCTRTRRSRRPRPLRLHSCFPKNGCRFRWYVRIYVRS